MEILRSAIAGFLTYLVTLVDPNSAQCPSHEINRHLVESTPKGIPLLQGVDHHVPVNSGHVGLRWHPPNPSEINNLTATINATGVYGFVFNSSVTPASLPYGTYNWCNMPHVRPQEYSIPPKEYKLEYVEVIHRHHKRTPYATNAFPHETHPWRCDDERLFHYAVSPPQDSSAHITWQVDTSDSNPSAPIGFHGSCQFPQITSQGLRDSRQHGQDLFDVYHRLLGFLPSTYDPLKLQYRATNNLITSQVIGHIIQGQFPDTANMPVAVRVQPPSIDSLEPSYSCPSASSLHRAYAVGSSAANWMLHLDQSAALFTKLDSVSGVDPTAPDWHSWFDHYYDNLSARLCHQKSLPCQSTNASNCITQADADSVFRRGQYEYSFVYRDAPQSLTASLSSFGIWVSELASNLRVVVDSGRQLTRGPASKVLYRHNVAHDGSISHLLSILQVDIMVWPGMGAELVFELYRRDVDYHLRVLWGGNILTSSNPHLGTMDLIPVQAFLAYIDGLVGPKGANVPHLCHEAKDRVG